MSQTIPAIFRDTVAAYSSKDALLTKENGRFRAITYREFHEEVSRLASALVELGIGPGERVAILSENRPEWLVVDQAVLSLGAVVVPIYPSLTPSQVRHILADADAMIAFCSTAQQAEKIQACRAELPSLRHVVAFDKSTSESSVWGWPEHSHGDGPAKDATREALTSGRGDGKIQAWSEILSQGAESMDRTERDRAERASQITPEWLASLVYTSGTTGEPKGAMLSHGNFVSNAQSAASLLDISHTDLTLSYLPLSHVLERMATYIAILRGATIAFAESIENLTVNIGEIHPTYLACVPRVLEKIHDRVMNTLQEESPIRREIFLLALDVGEQYHAILSEFGRVPFPINVLYELAERFVFAKLRDRLGGRLRFVFSGGAPLPKTVGEFFHHAGIPVVEGYGLTETSPIITLNPPSRPRFGTVGKPIPGVAVRIADDGEIICRGPNVMEGYWHKPEATREVLDANGWFHTGDIGSFDEEGYLRIVDRKKEVIVMSNGKKVAPQPIENRLRENALVDHAMLVGEGRNFLTALLVANAEALQEWAGRQGFSEVDSGRLVLLPEVRAHFDRLLAELNSTLAPFEQIKNFSLLPSEWTIESGELTPSLKIKRRVVLKRYQERIDALYSGPGQPMVSERVAIGKATLAQ